MGAPSSVSPPGSTSDRAPTTDLVSSSSGASFAQRWRSVVLVAAVAALGVTGLQVDAAGAAMADAPVVQDQPDDQEGDAPSIIPKPNSGRAPETPGDRGGWLQLSLFAATVAAVGVIVLLVARDMRRARRRSAPGAQR